MLECAQKSKSSTYLVLILTISLEAKSSNIARSICSKTFRDVICKEIWNGLLGLKKDLYEGFGKIRVSFVVERGSKTPISDTASTS